MVRDGDFVALFHSIHKVMRAEKVLKERRLQILLIPAPRALAADCGLALRYPPAARPAVEAALAEEGLAPVEIFVKEGAEFRNTKGPELSAEGSEETRPPSSFPSQPDEREDP